MRRSAGPPRLPTGLAPARMAWAATRATSARMERPSASPTTSRWRWWTSSQPSAPAGDECGDDDATADDQSEPLVEAAVGGDVQVHDNPSGAGAALGDECEECDETVGDDTGSEVEAGPDGTGANHFWCQLPPILV